MAEIVHPGPITRLWTCNLEEATNSKKQELIFTTVLEQVWHLSRVIQWTRTHAHTAGRKITLCVTSELKWPNVPIAY